MWMSRLTTNAQSETEGKGRCCQKVQDDTFPCRETQNPKGRRTLWLRLLCRLRNRGLMDGSLSSQ